MKNNLYLTHHLKFWAKDLLQMKFAKDANAHNDKVFVFYDLNF